MDKEGINVLSLFDGMSCGQIALERAGIKVNNYYASEIDKYAIQVTKDNYPNTIQLGSVVDVDVYKLLNIDLLIGGSPCQSFSFAGRRKGMSTKCEIQILTIEHYLQLKKDGYEFEGQSYLFWEYIRLLNDVRQNNPNVKFLLENVEMGERWEKVLSKAIGVNGIHINSRLVSAQNRQRIYWTNIGLEPRGFFNYMESIIEQPKDKGILLPHILEENVDEKYFLSEKAIKYIINPTRIKKGFTSINGDKGLSLMAGYERKQGTHISINCNGDISNDKAGTITKRYGKGVESFGGSSFIFDYTKIDKFGNHKADQSKASCFTAGGHSGGNHSDMDLIVHNTLPRSSSTGKGGVGALSRNNGKTYCLDTRNTNAVEFKSNIRRLTPLECERLQTVRDNYTNTVSDTQRYKMLGNGWTVDVIVHILKHIHNV